MQIVNILFILKLFQVTFDLRHRVKSKTKYENIILHYLFLTYSRKISENDQLIT